MPQISSRKKVRGSGNIVRLGTIISSSTHPDHEEKSPRERRGLRHHPGGIVAETLKSELENTGAPWQRWGVQLCTAVVFLSQ